MPFMRRSISILFLFLASCHACCQKMGNTGYYLPKTLLLEKIGTRHQQAYQEGDRIKIQTKNREMLAGNIWEIDDTIIYIGIGRPVALSNIAFVYREYGFPRRLGSYLFLGGLVYFGIVTVNHLLNNEQVFTKDMFIVPTSLFGVGLICLALSEKRCKIGDRWKLKVLEIRMN
jgi:hypothetical protein